MPQIGVSSGRTQGWPQEAGPLRVLRGFTLAGCICAVAGALRGILLKARDRTALGRAGFHLALRAEQFEFARLQSLVLIVFIRVFTPQFAD